MLVRKFGRRIKFAAKSFLLKYNSPHNLSAEKSKVREANAVFEEEKIYALQFPIEYSALPKAGNFFGLSNASAFAF
ncbi:MAG TPA: hypothetical protein VK400_01565 [Pyrinomonadaceae bacterium]|nr:hypothetical protein [Pyrinomonadaceae bacterium]